MVKIRLLLVVAALTVVFGWADLALAQDNDAGSKAVQIYSTAGAIRARAPGRMVSAGIARAAEAQDRLLSRPKITQTSRPRDAASQLRSDLTIDLFQGLLPSIVEIFGRIFAQLGIDLSLPDIPGLPE